jgi:hypothetical protein
MPLTAPLNVSVRLPNNPQSNVMKKRITVPQKVRDQVLREFNHLCALCGASNPQVHHIDENPSNNDPENLLPLFPNCHLTDQHNPTARIDTNKLRLFRKHKDPAILSHQFEPLFQRLQFLDSIDTDSDVQQLQRRAEELIAFIAALQMGEFYSSQIANLITRAYQWHVSDFYGSNPEYDREYDKEEQQYRYQLQSAREGVYQLTMELLRYQSWGTAKIRDAT